MASVSGSKLSFFAPDLSTPVNIILSDGTNVTGATVRGAYNVEVFTSVVGAAAPLVNATALIEGARLVAGTTNEVQAGTLSSIEQLLAGSHVIVDHTGGQLISAGNSASYFDTVYGSSGDTIEGGAGPGGLLVDASNARSDIVVGPETIHGGGGHTTVWAAKGDSITGGSGAMVVVGDASKSPQGGSGNMTVVGGSASLTVTDIGAHNLVTGSESDFTYIDDSFAGGFGNTITAGGGDGIVIGPIGTVMTVSGAGGPVTLHGSYIKAGIGDVIDGGHTVLGGTVGGGPMLVVGNVNDTINAGLSSAPTVWGGTANSVTGGTANLDFTDAGKALNTVVGGSGGLYAFNLGTGDSIVGGSGGTVPGSSIPGSNPVQYYSNVIDDSFNLAMGNNTLVGGSAASSIIAGPNDSVAAGSGNLLADIRDYLGRGNTVTVDLTRQGASGSVLRDDAAATVPSVPSPTGANASVVGFDTAIDTIASATSVDSTGHFQGTSNVQNGGTLLTFHDGTTMFLSGVTNPGAIKFIQ